MQVLPQVAGKRSVREVIFNHSLSNIPHESFSECFLFPNGAGVMDNERKDHVKTS